MTRRSRDVAEKVEKCIGNPIVKKMTQKLASKEKNSSTFYPKELFFLHQTRFLVYKQNLFLVRNLIATLTLVTKISNENANKRENETKEREEIYIMMNIFTR